MKRLLLFVGPVFAVAAAIVLFSHTRSIADVFKLALMISPEDSFHPMAESLTRLRVMAVSGIVLNSCFILACLVPVARLDRLAITLAGRLTFGVAGLIMLAGGCCMSWGVHGIRAGFIIIGTSASIPKPEHLSAIVQTCSPIVVFGSAVLAIGTGLSLVACLIGYRRQAEGQAASRSPIAVLATVICAVIGGISMLLFLGIMLHGGTLGHLLSNSSGPPPRLAELGARVSGIINFSLLAFAACGLQGLLQALVGVLSPSPS